MTQQAHPDLMLELKNLEKKYHDRPQEALVVKVVGEVLSNLSKGLSVEDLKLYHELESLHDFIEQAKKEISSIAPSEIQEEHLPLAADELSEVVAATEEATGKILDAAELIDEIAGKVEGDIQAKLSEASTIIYEASNFQDITGQRISKVTSTLSYIDEKIESLLTAFGGKGLPPKPKTNSKKQPDDKDLMNGPQLSKNAQKQEDVDALFDSL